jgi:hypothetical protein
MMEEGEEEQADPDDVFTQYCDFVMEEVEEEADAENSIAEDDDALSDVINDAQRDCKSEKEKLSLTKCYRITRSYSTHRPKMGRKS